MGKVLVTKYKDINGVCPTGCQFAADTDSDVQGMQVIDLGEYPVGCGDTPIPTMNCLVIIDPIYGRVYIGETLDSWGVKIGASDQSADKTREKSYTIDGTVHPAGTTLTDASLYNITLLEVKVGNVPLALSTITYTQDTTAHTGTLTFPAALGTGDVVDVIYNAN